MADCHTLRIGERAGQDFKSKAVARSTAFNRNGPRAGIANQRHIGNDGIRVQDPGAVHVHACPGPESRA